MRSVAVTYGLRGHLLDVLIGVAVSLVAAVVIVRLGLPVAVLFGVALITVTLAAQTPRGLAVVLIILAPLPSFGAAVGQELPLGLEPLGGLHLLALGISLLRPRPVVSIRSAGVLAVIATSFLLLLVAWYRTYGQESVSLADVSLFAKPMILALAAFVAVNMLEPKQALPTVAIAFAVGLIIIDASVMLERVGLYSPDYEQGSFVFAGASAAFKPGGVLLHGNTAGPVIAAFTLPAFVLLRATGKTPLGLALVAAAIPALISSLSRGSMVAFAVVLIAFAVVQRDRVRNGILVLAVTALALGWLTTGGAGERDVIASSFQAKRFDVDAQLSGRIDIWESAGDYLDSPERLAVGGGLDDFRDFASTTALKGAFATHNTLLYALTTGGLVMALSLLALFVTLLVAPGVRDPTLRAALRLAVIGLVVAGLSGDVTPFVPIAAWLWVLVALCYRNDQAGSHGSPAPMPAGV